MKYYIFIPSGNPTALVIGGLPDKFERQKINDEIMRKHNFVEQVGFLDDKFNLVMAGGEQCLNAIRCAGYYFLKRLNLDKVVVKSCEKSFICRKNSDDISVESKIKLDIENLSECLTKVKLDGITHLVYEQDMDSLNELELKKFAFEKLEKYNLVEEKACGFMVFDKNTLKPIVYVKDINTLFYETACGSGSLACALVKFNQTKKELNLSIKQPSSANLNVSVKNYKDGYCEYTISGKIKEYIV